MFPISSFSCRRICHAPSERPSAGPLLLRSATPIWFVLSADTVLPCLLKVGRQSRSYKYVLDLPTNILAFGPSCRKHLEIANYGFGALRSPDSFLTGGSCIVSRISDREYQIILLGFSYYFDRKVMPRDNIIGQRLRLLAAERIRGALSHSGIDATKEDENGAPDSVLLRAILPPEGNFF